MPHHSLVKELESLKPFRILAFRFRLTRSESSSQRRIDPNFADRQPRQIELPFSHRIALARRSLVVRGVARVTGACSAERCCSNFSPLGAACLLRPASGHSQLRVAHRIANFVLVNPLLQVFLGLVTGFFTRVGRRSGRASGGIYRACQGMQALRTLLSQKIRRQEGNCRFFRALRFIAATPAATLSDSAAGLANGFVEPPGQPREADQNEDKDDGVLEHGCGFVWRKGNAESERTQRTQRKSKMNFCLCVLRVLLFLSVAFQTLHPIICDATWYTTKLQTYARTVM